MLPRINKGFVTVLLSIQYLLYLSVQAQTIENIQPRDNVRRKHQSSKNEWLSPLLASGGIMLTSLVGVLVLMLCQKNIDTTIKFMNSFAAGCLLGACVFQLYPEGSDYLSGSKDWIMGACVLAGVIFALFIEQSIHLVLNPHEPTGVMSPSNKRYQKESTMNPDQTKSLMEEGKFSQEQEQKAEAMATALQVQPIAFITAIADILHAFTDGVVLAIAFKSCNTSVGWAVALGIMLHEVPHRVGDFFIFLNAGLRIPQAVGLNFLASCASLLGIVVLKSFGDVDDHTLGALLLFGAGTLLFIALTALLPPMIAVRDRKNAILHFICFFLGGAVIGLSSMRDVECEL